MSFRDLLRAVIRHLLNQVTCTIFISDNADFNFCHLRLLPEVSCENDLEEVILLYVH